jgi:hypothetical protein
MATSTELVAGGFITLSGVFLTKIFDLLGNRSKAKHDLNRELRAKHFDKKLDVYRKLAVAIEPMVVTSPVIPSVDEFREIYRDLLFVSSPEVMVAFREVLTTSHEKLLARGMTVQQSRDCRSDVARTLYNSMRSDLFPGQKPLPWELIGFLEPKVSGTASETGM